MNDQYGDPLVVGASYHVVVMYNDTLILNFDSTLVSNDGLLRFLNGVRFHASPSLVTNNVTIMFYVHPAFAPRVVAP